MAKKQIMISITEKQNDRLNELREKTGLPKSGIIALALENLPMFMNEQ